MSVTRRIAGLLDIAAEDASGAAILARTHNRNSAYLCQQASEKLIKAVLLDHGIEAGADHHLDALVAKLPDGHPWKERLRTRRSPDRNVDRRGSWRAGEAARLNDVPPVGRGASRIPAR